MPDNLIDLSDVRNRQLVQQSLEKLMAVGMPRWLADFVVAYGQIHNLELDNPPHLSPLDGFHIQPPKKPLMPWDFFVTTESNKPLRTFSLRIGIPSRTPHDPTLVDVGGPDFLQRKAALLHESADKDPTLQSKADALVRPILSAYSLWLKTGLGNQTTCPAALSTLSGLLSFLTTHSTIVRVKSGPDGELIYYFALEPKINPDTTLYVTCYQDTIHSHPGE